MTCENAIEFLPWLLNGTLSAEEGGEVRRHLETCERCRQALAETRDAWRLFAQHVPTAALVSYAWGETPSALDPGLIEEHLRSCPQCAAELEMVRTSRRLEEDEKIALFPGKPKPKAEAKVYRGWRASALAASLAGLVAISGWIHSSDRVRSLESQLAERPSESARPAVPAETPPPVAPGEVVKPAEPETSPDQLAALQGENERLAAEVERLGARRPPLQTLQSVEIRAAEVMRGEEPAPAHAQEIPAGAPVLLKLVADHLETHTDHEYELFDAAGNRVAPVSRGLRRDDNENYNVVLDAGALKPGTYTLRVYARENGERVETESYTLRLP